MSAHWMSAPWNRLGDSRLSESRLSGMTPYPRLKADATKELCSSQISAHGNWLVNDSLLNGWFDV